MLRAGVDAHRVQRILRHASVTTTTGTYTILHLGQRRSASSGCRSTYGSPLARHLARRQVWSYASMKHDRIDSTGVLVVAAPMLVQKPPTGSPSAVVSVELQFKIVSRRSFHGIHLLNTASDVLTPFRHDVLVQHRSWT